LSFATRVFGLATLSIAAVGIPLALLGDSSIPPQGRWLLVVVGAAGFALLIARFAEREVAALVRRLAEATSALSTDGEPWRGYVGAREGREVRELERAFHNLVEAVELSHRARERSYVEAVGAVVAAVDARDHEITGHSIRVARYAVAVARAMGIDDPATLRAMEWGALLHVELAYGFFSAAWKRSLTIEQMGPAYLGFTLMLLWIASWWARRSREPWVPDHMRS
jgi:hypothetical protein